MNILDNTDEPEEDSSEQNDEGKKKHKNGYCKNVIGYEAKKAIGLMFSHHSKYLSNKCKELGIQFRLFKRKYNKKINKLYGPVELSQLLKIDDSLSENDKKMKKLFCATF